MLYGTVTTPDGLPYAQAAVEVKAEDFSTIFRTETDDAGHYALDLPDGDYPFVISVKDYAVSYLEYWAHNVRVHGMTELNMRFDALEVYGLNVFRVKGGYPSLHLYFRPMSLEKFRAGEDDIAPEISQLLVKVNGVPAEILHQDRVGEFIGGRVLTAYLVQVSLPGNADSWHRVDVEIMDREGHFGMATLFA